MALVFAVFLAASSTPALAADVGSCEERNVILNQVLSMRSYANGSVKLFAIDQEEPAASPAGIAVTIDRGDSLADAESFCRYVFGLSSLDLDGASASYDQASGVLTIVMAARSYVADTDQFVDNTLTLAIDKAAKDEAALVSARLQ